MKKIALLGILTMTSAFADSGSQSEYEHRVNFGLLNLGYERIKSDCLYLGLDVKFNPIWTEIKHLDRSYRLDHMLNGEMRVGYNHSLGERDAITPYLGIGHTLYSLEKVNGNTKHLSSASAGLKYLHQFGEVFEMGLHLKGSYGFYQKTHKIDPVTGHSTTVKEDDAVWTPEVGLPMVWHVGEAKNWEIQFEPSYTQIPNSEKQHIVNSKFSLGYRF